MDIYEAIVIGIVQGVAEWLPISSEGMISLVMVRFFGKSLSEALPMALWLHLGTMISALVYFRKDVLSILKDFFTKEVSEGSWLGKFIIISTLFSVVVAVPIYYLLRNININASFAMLLIGVMLIITGVMQRLSRKGNAKPNVRHAIPLGLAQGLAVIPGISRSGTTVSVMLFLKYRAERAFEISFLMSIPLVFVGIVGMVVFEPISFNVEALVALLVAFVVGLASIKGLMGLAKKIDFSYLCFVLGFLSVLAFFI